MTYDDSVFQSVPFISSKSHAGWLTSVDAYQLAFLKNPADRHLQFLEKVIAGAAGQLLMICHCHQIILKAGRPPDKRE